MKRSLFIAIALASLAVPAYAQSHQDSGAGTKPSEKPPPIKQRYKPDTHVCQMVQIILPGQPVSTQCAVIIYYPWLGSVSAPVWTRT